MMDADEVKVAYAVRPEVAAFIDSLTQRAEQGDCGAEAGEPCRLQPPRVMCSECEVAQLEDENERLRATLRGFLHADPDVFRDELAAARAALQSNVSPSAGQADSN
jgi:hypothetical protein